MENDEECKNNGVETSLQDYKGQKYSSSVSRKNNPHVAEMVQKFSWKKQKGSKKEKMNSVLQKTLYNTVKLEQMKNNNSREVLGEDRSSSTEISPSLLFSQQSNSSLSSLVRQSGQTIVKAGKYDRVSLAPNSPIKEAESMTQTATLFQEPQKSSKSLFEKYDLQTINKCRQKVSISSLLNKE